MKPFTQDDAAKIATSIANCLDLGDVCDCETACSVDADPLLRDIMVDIIECYDLAYDSEDGCFRPASEKNHETKQQGWAT